MMIPQIPFVKEGDKVRLTGMVFLSCGCGNVTARWATIQQGLTHRIPQVKPKSNRVVSDWLTQEGLREKWAVLKQHQYGVVVGETEKGFEMIDVMGGVTSKVTAQIADLIRRHNEYRSNH